MVYFSIDAYFSAYFRKYKNISAWNKLNEHFYRECSRKGCLFIYKFKLSLLSAAKLSMLTDRHNEHIDIAIFYYK